MQGIGKGASPSPLFFFALSGEFFKLDSDILL